MHRGRHGDGDFAVRYLNLAADSHDGVRLGLLLGEARELDEVAGQLRVADERRAGLLRYLDRVADVVAVAVRYEYVVDLRDGGQRVFAVLRLRVRRVGQPRVYEQNLALRRRDGEGRVPEPLDLRLLRGGRACGSGRQQEHGRDESEASHSHLLKMCKIDEGRDIESRPPLV